MPKYTVQDSETGRKIAFEWYGEDPPTDADLDGIFMEARVKETTPPSSKPPPKKQNPLAFGVRGNPTEQAMMGTLENIGQVYPALETAATAVTSLYGVPISGLVGLAALPLGLDAANNAVEAVQKHLVYRAQTEKGGELTQASEYPLRKLSEVGTKVADPLYETGYPDIAAATKTGIEGLPLLLGVSRASKKFANIVDKGIDKGVRPSVIKKEVWAQRKRYMRNARDAVKSIIKNKDQLKLKDQFGNERTGLPKTLEEFGQAIDQTKRRIFSEYDRLARETETPISMDPVIRELYQVATNKEIQTLSPETIAHVKKRIDGLTEFDIQGNPLGAKNFTASELQNMIQMLNQSEKALYANPGVEMAGRAYVDMGLANNFRSAIDAAIESATGKEYQALKRQYGNLRMLETDVTKRAIVDARKAQKVMLDFTDVFSGYHMMRGILTFDPATIAAGGGSKALASYYKHVNNPNTRIRKMFKGAEKARKRRSYNRQTVGVGAGAIMGRMEDIMQ